jgi:hypothetical protein
MTNADGATVCRLPFDAGFRRRHRGGDAALHVRRPAAKEDAVAQDRLERVRMPLLRRPGRDDVGVAGEAKHRPRPAPANRPEIVHLAEAHALDGKSCTFEPRGNELLAARIVRRDRISADQFLRKFQRL